MTFDVIIKNGTLFDGKGSEPQFVDVGVKGGEIKKLGDLGKESASEIIEAKGKYVCPGFIDLTNHSDTYWTLLGCPTQESLLRQGITTIIGGNCGSSLAPFIGEGTREDLKRWIDISKINISWRSIEEFLAILEDLELGLNFGTLVGFNTVQAGVLGREIKFPTEAEIRTMNFLLKDSLNQGAFGISANLGISQIKSLRDEALEKIFDLDEDNVFIKNHLENEGEALLPAVSRLVSLARKLRARMHIGHFKALGRNSWPFFESAIQMIRRAREEGINMTVDFFPYSSTGSSLINLFPEWVKLLSASEIQGILRAKDDKRRDYLIDYLKSITLHYDRIIIGSASSSLSSVGKSIAEIMKNSDLSGEEIILNLLETNGLRVSIFNEVISWENLYLIAKEDFAAVASDGIGYNLKKDLFKDFPHPRCFGAFPKALRIFVKEKNIVDWKNLIYKMTGLPAKIMNIEERGVIEEGKAADLVVFDPQEITDLATYEEPYQYSQGIENVLVNGKSAIDKKNFTGTLAGQVLRKK